MKSNILNLQEKEYKAYINQKLRVRIRNAVKRNNISTNCCICNQPGEIMYDFENPYEITFICRKCRNDKANLELSKSHKINIQEVLSEKTKDNLSQKHLKALTDDQIKEIVEDYIRSNMLLGDYCKEKDISRYHLNKLIEKYGVITKDKKFKSRVEEHYKRLRRESYTK